MEKRILSTEITTEDEKLEFGLRPQYLEEYIGQQKLKDKLKVSIDAAKLRGDALDHVLLYGPPGLGKTTLAGIIANEMGAHLKITSGPAIEKTGEIAAILNGLEEHDVLFIDEIHRLNRQVEEFLYSAMEDYAIDILIGKGPMAKSVRLGLPKFTLVGATTMSGNLSAPLRARFGMAEKLEYYTDRELMMIIMASADKLNVSIDMKGAELLAMRSRGTPRIANRLLKRVRDYAQVRFDGVITDEVVETSLELLGVDTLGLDDANLEILRVMVERFEGKPVGLDNLAASIGEDANTIKEVYEPFLLQKGLIIRTPRGRKITRAGYEYLGLEHLYKESE